jgi:hypothetical protein
MKMSDLHIEQMERDESPSTIQIEKNFPIPKLHRGKARILDDREKKMILSMDVGDSFLAPEHMIQRPKRPQYPYLKQTVRVFFREANRQCTSRFSKEGLRVWRIQ